MTSAYAADDQEPRGGRRERGQKLPELWESQGPITICTGWSIWILYRKLKYYICCFTDALKEIERDLSNTILNTSISGLKSSWTTLYLGLVADVDTDTLNLTVFQLFCLFQTANRWFARSSSGIPHGGTPSRPSRGTDGCEPKCRKRWEFYPT